MRKRPTCRDPRHKREATMLRFVIWLLIISSVATFLSTLMYFLLFPQWAY